MTKKEITELEKSAKAGGKKATSLLNALGVDCQYGNNGQKVDLVLALHFYTIAAEGGNVNAMCNAAYCFAVGSGTIVDAGKAFYWYKKAAEAGDVNGMTNLGGCYLNGFGTNKDVVEAINWLLKAINSGNTAAKNVLNEVFAVISSTDIKLLKQSDASKAQFCMAEYYIDHKKYEEAISWYILSAQHGDAHAAARMNALGKEFHKGTNGRKIDEALACKFYINAAECGNIEAMISSASCFSKGIGIEKDTTMFFYWHEKAAKAGDVKSMSKLGFWFYLLGEGTSKNALLAKEWQEKALQAIEEGVDLETALVYFTDKKQAIQKLYTGDQLIQELLKLGEQCEKYNSKYRYNLSNIVKNIYEDAGEIGSAEAYFRLGQKNEDAADPEAPCNKVALDYYRKSAALGHTGAAYMYTTLNDAIAKAVQTRQTTDMQKQIAMLQTQLQQEQATAEKERKSQRERMRQAEEAQRATEAELRRQLDESKRQAEEAKRQAEDAKKSAAETSRTSANSNSEIDVTIFYDRVVHCSTIPDYTLYDMREYESMRESEYLALKGNYDALCAHIKGKYLGSSESVRNARIERDD